MSIMSEIEKLKEKYNIIHWFFMTMFFLGGLLLNSIYKVLDVIMLPFNQQKDITILLEKSEETSAMFEALKTIQVDIQQSKQNDDKIVKAFEGLTIEMKAELRKLEDGQLQLFLKTERLDERTLKRK